MIRSLRFGSKFYKTLSVISYRNYRKHQNSNENTPNSFVFGVGLVTLGSIYYLKKNVYAAEPDEPKRKTGEYVPELPTFKLDEVAKHDNIDSRIWVTYKQGVYDVTEFVDLHPGSSNILLAAGSSVEPFWMLYAVHNTPEIYALLETMRIGNISEQDAKSFTEDMIDPYILDPKRHEAIKPISKKPFNGETSPDILVKKFITPNELFFVRNHLPVPHIDPKKYELEIEIEDSETEPLVLKLEDIKKFPKHTVMTTVMCAGNRRSEMSKVKLVKGLDWGPAAVGNAVWTGAKLSDVLKHAGLEKSREYKHVQFEGYDLDATGKSYGSSIPFWRAVDERCETILAYEMNGEPLPLDHGFPIRVVVPGVVGARNVKWLSRVIVSDNESEAFWQQNDYKGFSPSVDWDTVDFKTAPAIQELPVISAICYPLNGDTVVSENGFITLRGYAWSGGGEAIIRVDITADQGRTWHVASLDESNNRSPPQHYSWTLWSVKIPIKEGIDQVEVWAKAVDSRYNTQSETFENIWNLRGVLNNAYHRIKLNIKEK